MNKKDLRKLYSDKRKNLSHSELLKFNDLLLIRFQNLSFSDPEILLSYAPIESKNEPDTNLFARYLKHVYPHLHLAYPVTCFNDFSIRPLVVNEETEFKINDYQIEEPVDGIEINAKDIDIVFVPMLICDYQGYRVGFGKGFYDRFLIKCKTDVIKIGFSFFEPVNQIDDIASHDIPLDFCITPSKIHHFG